MDGDLISRKDAKFMVKKIAQQIARQNGTVDDTTYVLKLVYDELEDALAVDAAPVVHGRWISHFDRSECSVCGGICWADSASTYDYCPNCGTKMDMEE